MNNNNNMNKTTVSYPTNEEINPFHQQQNQPQQNQPQQYQPQEHQPQQNQPQEHQPQPSQPLNHTPIPPPPTANSHPVPQETQQQSDHHFHQQQNQNPDAEKWGTQVMGHPAVPTCHPGNKKAAQWGAPREEAQTFHYPYLQYSPIENKTSSSSSSSNPGHSMIHAFNSWSNKAESLANNIWHNLKTGSSVSGAAWAKVNVTAKAITEGGFESMYKQTFGSFPNEKLKKTFACYLSTSTGPVAGTLYLTNLNLAFCSDRPLSFTAPSGHQSWSYYKIIVPFPNVGTVNPVVMRESASERYIQIVTIDGNDFWFMGFVNYEKASKNLTQSISTFAAPAYPPPAAH